MANRSNNSVPGASCDILFSEGVEIDIIKYYVIRNRYFILSSFSTLDIQNKSNQKKVKKLKEEAP